MHPGGIQTELTRHLPEGTLEAMLADIRSRQPAGEPTYNLKTIPQGAAPSVWAGVVADADAVGGRFCEDCHVAGVVDDDPHIPSGVRAYALDPKRAKALWAKSEEMVGEQFPN